MERAIDRPPRRVAALLCLLVAGAFALRVWNFDAYLPRIYYSDYVQVDQAADLLARGQFVERSSYPLTHTFVLAAVDALAYGVLWATGSASGWEEFVGRLAAADDPSLRHWIARLYTALLGAATVAALYPLARTRFGRGVSLFAAALLAVSPAHVAYAHQARIHVPGIFLLVCAAWAVLRAGDSRRPPQLLLAGAACSVVASIFQLGFVLAASSALWLAISEGCVKRGAGHAGFLAAGFAAALGVLSLLTHAGDWVIAAAGSGALESAKTLGIPSMTVEGVSAQRFLQRFPQFVSNWITAEPFVAIGVAWALWASRRVEGLRQGIFPFVTYPAVLFPLLGTTYTEVRYSLSATPFLAIVAAIGLTSIAAPALRMGLCAAALAVPLATSIRYDALLSRDDSRIVLEGVVRSLESKGVRIAIEDSLAVVSACGAGGRWQVMKMPPDGNFQAWVQGKESPRTTMLVNRRDVYMRGSGDVSPFGLSNADLESLRFQLCATIPGTPTPPPVLPDAPSNLLWSIWRAPRSGPTIEIFAEATLAQRSEAFFGSEPFVKVIR